MKIAVLKPEYENVLGKFAEVSEMESKLAVVYYNHPEYFRTLTVPEFVTEVNTGEIFAGIDMVIVINEQP